MRKQQSELDLYLAIVEEILGHKRYWHPYGWLRYPLSLILTRIARQLCFGLSTGVVGEAKLDVPLTLPRPTGQRALERLVARVRRSGRRTVVVLDEADRAAPLIAQAAVTLAVRALDLPGVVVVLSYVDEVMRYKAFNPLADNLPDLGSTMQALIYTAGPDQGGLGKPGGALDSYGRPQGSLREWEPWTKAEEMQLGDEKQKPPVVAVRGGDEPPASRDGEHRLCEALRLAYAGASPHDRRVLQRHFAQRYLGSRPIVLQRLGDDDVAEMLVRFDTLSYVVRNLVGPGKEDEAVAEAKRALATWKSWQTPAPEVASIRELEGELFRRLSEVTTKPVSPAFIAAVVVTAYDAAWRQYVRRRASS